ncbi:hypothetical protein Q5Y75_27330 [Ruegeria sp. 2205SS24-7]|uniref:hypothetical protein n=1 Tax=Ruegeria discodermiae TaxID=3064389 RepID=UPI002741CD77|nr:hypothetical protein [Ruegeria sp. 2205SS24-7]MDP5220904.1 hypothetical protein [Ruegeria sp. 2205SS24-7]
MSKRAVFVILILFACHAGANAASAQSNRDKKFDEALASARAVVPGAEFVDVERLQDNHSMDFLLRKKNGRLVTVRVQTATAKVVNIREAGNDSAPLKQSGGLMNRILHGYFHDRGATQEAASDRPEKAPDRDRQSSGEQDRSGERSGDGQGKGGSNEGDSKGKGDRSGRR